MNKTSFKHYCSSFLIGHIHYMDSTSFQVLQSDNEANPHRSQLKDKPQALIMNVKASIDVTEFRRQMPKDDYGEQGKILLELTLEYFQIHHCWFCLRLVGKIEDNLTSADQPLYTTTIMIPGRPSNTRLEL